MKVKMDDIQEETTNPGQKENLKFGHVGNKMVKYGSFDSATRTKRLRVSNSCHSWQAYNSSGFTGCYISPPGSSNTLTGTMYTASEGVRTSVSGMTSFSDSVFDDPYLTPIGGSKTSVDEITMKNSYNSDSGSSLEYDFQKENALNEEKLKDIKLQRDSSKDSLKRKLIKGINGKSKHKDRLKRSKECVTDDSKNKNGIYNTKKAVVPGILKKSISSDSSVIPTVRRDKCELEPIIGGTRAVLVKKENKPSIIHTNDNSQLLYPILEKLNNIQTTCTSTTVNELNERISRIEESMNKLTSDLYHVKEDANTKYHDLNAKVNYIQDRADKTDHELENAINRKAHVSGTTYIRWGRSTCPGNGSEAIYSGYAGGSYYGHKGAAVSMLCLPKDPDWLMHSAASDSKSGLIYGVEYQPSSGRTDTFFGKYTANHDVPCVVCNIGTRSTSIIVPGKTRCHAGWTLEYTGYLMAGYYANPAATDYYCIDDHPETLPGGAEDRDGHLLYFVEARCGSLRCPPYKNYWELTCVVCSK